MRVLITGATGLIGRQLSQYLIEQGHDVHALHRNPESEKDFYWFPAESRIHLDDSVELDAVIHLAGDNIAGSRWSEAKKAEIINSRVRGTRLLSEAVAQLKHKPSVFISASAIGYYGDTGDSIVDEQSSPGTGFLSDIATQWEQATQAVEQANIRTVHLRTGIVLSRNGGALEKMLLPFKLGLGGVVGSGQQYMSWISIHDVVSIIDFLLHRSNLSGPFNLVAPQAATNRQFTKSLGHALHRPTIFPMPAFVVRVLFGEMGDQLLLSSTRVAPKRLLAEGYSYIDEQLDGALEHVINE